MNQNIRNADVLFSVLLLLRWNACEIYQFLMSYWHTKKASIVCSDTNSTSASPFSLPNIQSLACSSATAHVTWHALHKRTFRKLDLGKDCSPASSSLQATRKPLFSLLLRKGRKKIQKDLWKIREARTAFFFFCGILFWVVEFFREWINASLNKNLSGLTLSVPHTWLLRICAQCYSLSMSTCTWRGRYFS